MLWRATLLLSVAATTRLFAVATESAIPTAQEPGRYQSMLEQSPFALATATIAPTAPKESFAANWNLTGLAKLPDSDGVTHDFVTIRSRDARIAFSLYGDQVNHDGDTDGVSLASVDWNPNEPRKSVATLKKGTEFAKVEFGQETAAPPAGIQAARPASPIIRAPGSPGGAPQPFAGAVNPAVRSPGAPPAINRPVLPRPGNNGVQQLPGMNSVVPITNPNATSPNSGRKIRVINSRP